MKTTYHKNGEVTFWNVYRQGWQRMHATRISDKILATLPDKDRNKIEKHANQYPTSGDFWNV